MKKKIVSFMMAAMMVCSFAACGGSSDKTNTEDINTVTESEISVSTEKETPSVITIQSFDGNKELIDLELPYAPEKIAVLDMAALDILDSLGLGDKIVGSAKVNIDYLMDYNPDSSNGTIMNLGTVKTADLEKVAACEPDVIFIGGRLASIYNELSAIAPVVYLGVDYEKGVVNSTVDNAKTIASIWGKEAEVDAKMEGFQKRIDALNAVLNGKDVLLCMYNSNAMSLMDTESQLNIIAKELGAQNLGENVGETEKATHGEEASWETIINLNPEYMFVLDRSTATGAAEEGVLGIREVIENDLIKELDVYKDEKIVYFIEHAGVWYTATGGIQALDIMLADLEGALLEK